MKKPDVSNTTNVQGSNVKVEKGELDIPIN